jgi:hypothetical protein
MSEYGEEKYIFLSGNSTRIRQSVSENGLNKIRKKKMPHNESYIC